MRIYRTVDGDMLDHICIRAYGDTTHLEAVLAANPGLADLGAVYAAGVRITLPVFESNPVRQPIRLWGAS